MVHVAKLIQNAFRTEDIACRYGGEEFCVLLRNCHEVQALQLATNLVAGFSAEAIDVLDGRRVTVTTSVGVCVRIPGKSLLSTLQHADDALYNAKNQGRNRALLHVSET